MKLKAITSALAGAGIVALAGASGSAQAGAMAGAMVNMTNFQILKSTDGGTTSDGIVLVSDLQSLSFTSTMDMQATLNGATTGNIDQTSQTFSNGIDAPATCIGTGCVGAINFTTDNLFPKPAAPVQGNYAAVDQLENGSPISGLTGYSGLADVANGSYVGLATGSGSATTTSNNNLQASWQFTVASGINALAFDFDLDVFLQAFLDATETAPTFATANYDFNFTLSCLQGTSCGLFGLNSIAFAPNLLPGLTKTISLNAPLASGTEIFLTSGTVHQNSGFIPVVAGTSLQLSARINTLADLERVAPRVPEPGVLALLGLGLFGIGATLRKKVAG